MKHFLTLLLITSSLIPKSSFAQINPREDGSYEWKDATNSRLRENITFATNAEGEAFATVSDREDFEMVKYSIVNNEIVFTLEGDGVNEKKYTCRLKNGILLAEISESNSSESLKRSYTFMITPNAMIQQPEIIAIPDEEEIEEEIFVDLEQEDEYAEEVFTLVDTQPQFPGGMPEFYNWIESNLKYPVEAKKMGVEGRVYVEFIVNTDGSVSDIKVLRGVGSGCDKEAIRLIENCPKWVPGEQWGSTVRVRMTLPVSFKII